LDPEDDKQLKSYCYHRDALQFIIEIHKAIPIICELLGSKNSSDVLEAIQFFVTAQHFNIERAKVSSSAILCTKLLLSLILLTQNNV
jgi:hypothetical protein